MYSSSMSTESPLPELRDTIPRMYHLTYLPVVLVAIAGGLNFDTIRRRVWEEARAMSRRAGPVAPQIDDGYVHWSTTKDALGECMKLSLVERASLPSKRAQADAHRERTYALTDGGRRLVEQFEERPSAFRQLIAPVLIESHPYFAALLKLVQEHPIVLRTYTEEELREHKRISSLWVDRVAEEVALHSEETMGLPATTEAITGLAAGLREGLRRRFASDPSPRPKDVLDTVDDTVCALTLERLGLSVDAISFNVMMSWSRWLYVAEESRYVCDRPGRVVWASADVSVQEPYEVVWRGVREHGDLVASLLPEAYRDLATLAGHPVDAAPLLPIHEVRATAAFRARVPVPVVDRVIAQVADNERSVPYQIRLAVAGAALPPRSEPQFYLGDRPYYVLSISPKPVE